MKLASLARIVRQAIGPARTLVSVAVTGGFLVACSSGGTTPTTQAGTTPTTQSSTTQPANTHKGSNTPAAQTNLVTALTAAKTFYVESNQTFTGIAVESSTVSDIQSLDPGLSFVTEGNSAGNRSISVYVNGAGTSVVLVAWAPGTGYCWGILDNTAVQQHEPLGLALPKYKAIGTWYFGVGGGTQSECEASSTGPTPAATGISAVGWSPA